MAREESEKERVIRALKGFFRLGKEPKEVPETKRQIRQESGKDIKIMVGDFASDLNLPESLDIRLPLSEDNPNENKSIRYFSQNEELFLVETALGENAIILPKLSDKDWVRYGPTVLKALMDIKNTLNPPTKKQ